MSGTVAAGVEPTKEVKEGLEGLTIRRRRLLGKASHQCMEEVPGGTAEFGSKTCIQMSAGKHALPAEGQSEGD